VYQDPESPVISRHFVNFRDRQVHFRLAGSGPPLLLLHQSPTSSAEMATEMESFAEDFTVIAPDTPGFGLSDPLPDERRSDVPDLTPFAEALEEFLSALGIEKTLIYGFHTGAMLGFEFARLYPERCAAAIVNGLVVCEPAELADLLQNYNVMPALTPEGAHLPWMWARMRDQTLFFPWYKKEPAARMDFDLPDPGLTHDRLIDFLRAEEGGRAAYQAAFAYPTRERIGETKAPVYLVNYSQDPLAGHPERLAKIPDDIPREIFVGPDAVHHRLNEILRDRAPAPVRLQPASIGFSGDAVDNCGDSRGKNPGDDKSAGRLLSEIVNTEAGPVFVRCSSTGPDSAVIWLHDAGSSSRALAPAAARLAGSHRVVLVDLPGHGETGTLRLEDYSAERIAKLVFDVMAGLDIENVSVVAQGAACAIAVAMLRTNSDANPPRNLVLIDPWLFDPAERDRLIANYAPELQPQEYGEHLLAAWYFARDGELFWPWNAPLAANALPREPEISPAKTQERAIDAIKAGPRFHRLVRDLLAYDLAGNLDSMASHDVRNVRIAARGGNGHEARAKRAADLARASYAVLPERLDDWAPELDECLR
jgi:pimeloyl-ACP methyl ester carboxylesterase